MKKALLVGINTYPDPANALNGCINDVNDMQQFLTAHAGFAAADIMMLQDAGATRAAVATALRQLVASARAGDQIVFHYSGHGCQMPEVDASGNTTSVHDAMCPYDFDWTTARAIRDVDFQTIFRGVPAAARIDWISDSCYSGGYAKLFRAFIGAPVRLIKTIPAPPSIHAQIHALPQSRPRSLMRDAVQTLPHVLLLSACTAAQEAEDSSFGGRANGALTYELLQELQTGQGLTEAADAVLTNVAGSLQRDGYSQTPDLHGDRELFSTPVFG
jgi:hypothetical protein